MKRLYQNLTVFFLFLLASFVFFTPSVFAQLCLPTSCGPCQGSLIGGVVPDGGGNPIRCVENPPGSEMCTCVVITPTPTPVPPMPLPTGTASEWYTILNFNTVIENLYAVAVPLAIGYAIFSIIKAGYSIKLSEGNPQKYKEAIEEMSSAITGTLFILLSAGLLRVIITALL